MIPAQTPPTRRPLYQVLTASLALLCTPPACKQFQIGSGKNDGVGNVQLPLPTLDLSDSTWNTLPTPVLDIPTASRTATEVDSSPDEVTTSRIAKIARALEITPENELKKFKNLLDEAHLYCAELQGFLEGANTHIKGGKIPVAQACDDADEVIQRMSACLEKKDLVEFTNLKAQVGNVFGFVGVCMQFDNALQKFREEYPLSSGLTEDQGACLDLLEKLKVHLFSSLNVTRANGKIIRKMALIAEGIQENFYRPEVLHTLLERMRSDWSHDLK
jgi:hypothetical protein